MVRQPVFIIAEAGVNHNGSLAMARRLVDVAALAGADAVKFQTFKAERLVRSGAEKAEYQKQSGPRNESQLEMLKRLELDTAAHRELQGYCKTKGIKFLSTPFDLPSIDLLCELGMDIFKIPSGEITNLPYLRKIGMLGKKVFLSTGMSYLEEVAAALEILGDSGTARQDIVALHCNTEYPSPVSDVNLLAMHKIGESLDVQVGYSDHTLGIEIPIAAAALGAQVIEKHFTLDKKLPGPDHRASLEPDELRQMVAAIRNVELALGGPEKRPSPSEMKNRIIARKSIVAARSISRGEAFSEENLTVKRPGSGLSPMRWDDLLGLVATRNYEIDELIEMP